MVRPYSKYSVSFKCGNIKSLTIVEPSCEKFMMYLTYILLCQLFVMCPASCISGVNSNMLVFWLSIVAPDTDV